MRRLSESKTSKLNRFAIVTLLGLMTCGGLDNFTVAEEGSAVIPAGGLIDAITGDLGFSALSDFDLAQSEEFKNRGAEKSKVDSVKLTSFELTVTDPPSGQDLSFLDSIKIYAEAPDTEKVLIAEGGPFAANATTVQLTVKDVELKPYVTAENMSVTTEATGHRPSQETTLEAKLLFDVDVDVSGAACGK